MRFCATQVWLLSAALSCVALPATAWGRDDWNLWHAETVGLFTQGRYSLSLYQTSRYRDAMSDIFFVQGKVINRYALHPNVHLAANYSYIQQKRDGNHWREEHRPEVELYPMVTVGPLALENRMRLELRTIEGASGEEDWRYRNRVQAIYTIPKTHGNVKLFANEEVFFAMPPDEWNQNRVFVGVRIAASRNASASISWGVQSLRIGSDWEDRQVLLAEVKLLL